MRVAIPGTYARRDRSALNRRADSRQQFRRRRHSSRVADGVLRELEGMRALARALAQGDADDLLQDAAVDVLGHAPPEAPPRAWLATVLRNRWRMTARGAGRRAAREQVVVPDEVETPDAALDRARTFERLANALVGLEEPFRQTVILRYLDGQSAAEIARTMNVPAGTVRWRLKTGLDRLRAALDDTEPRWRRAFVPLAGAGMMKAKTTSVAVVIVLLLLASVALYFFVVKRDDTPATKPAVATTTRPALPTVRKARIDAAVEAALPPGQGKPILDELAGPGVVGGRVINWSTGDGVEGADITFTNASGATTVRSGKGGAFELAPETPGRFVLTTISAPGFLPYAPELLHSNVHVEVVPNRAVRGITVFLFPAVDYMGIVVDAQGKPVPGAKVRLLGTPVGEQMIDKLETEWTSDKDGKFTFHAADDAVFIATAGKLRGYGLLDGNAAITHVMRIVVVGNAPARDRKIAGRVLAGDKPIANVLLRAEPEEQDPVHVRSVAFATTDANGAFVLEDVDDRSYELFAEADGYARGRLAPVMGGAKDVLVVLDKGHTIAGRVVDSGGDPVSSYTLLAFKRTGARRDLVLSRSIVDARGSFSVQVSDGEFDITAAASGWAPSEYVVARAGDVGVELKVSTGATLSGTVIAADGSGPIPYVRVMREARGGGSSVQPANAGTVTRQDGTFELTGIPPGPLSITVAGGGFHPKIEAGMTATDGAKLGPLTIKLVALKAGETPQLELVGIGVKLSANGKVVVVEAVIPGGGAEAAGIVAGDEVVAVDGIPVTESGLDGAVAKIRGVEGTTLSVTLQRNGKPVTLVVTRKKLKA